MNRMHHHVRRASTAFSQGRTYFLLLSVLAAAIFVLAFFSHTQKPFTSAEVKFTDASKSGLAIVPASCASPPGEEVCWQEPTSIYCNNLSQICIDTDRDPLPECRSDPGTCPRWTSQTRTVCAVQSHEDYPGQCDGTPPHGGDCSVYTQPAIISAGESATIHWQGTIHEDPTMWNGYWSFTYNNGTIAPDVGSVPISGSRTIAPAQTTTYVFSGTYDVRNSLLEGMGIIGPQPPMPFICDATITVCPAGQTWNGTACVPSSSCPAPRHIDPATNQCVCDVGYTYNAATNECLVTPTQCPLPRHVIGGVCRCNDGYTYNAANNTCVFDTCSTEGSGGSCVTPNGTYSAGTTLDGCTLALKFDPNSMCRFSQAAMFPSYTCTGGQWIGPNGTVFGQGRNPVDNQCHVLCPDGVTFAPNNDIYQCPTCDARRGQGCAFNSCGMSGGVIQCNGSCSGTPPSESLCPANAPRILTWLVRPLLVQKESPTYLTWSTVHVSSCSITGSNGDGKQGATCPAGWCATSGTHLQSGPIRGQTTYTLTCIGNDNSTIATSSVVNIVPVFIEN